MYSDIFSKQEIDYLLEIVVPRVQLLEDRAESHTKEELALVRSIEQKLQRFA